MTCEKLKWVADILARVRGKLAAHRDSITHSEAHRIREMIAEVDAASIIVKEKRKNEHTGSGDTGANPQAENA